MARTSSATPSQSKSSPRANGTNLDAWLLNDFGLNDDCLTLLAAYRQASDEARQAAAAQTVLPVDDAIEDDARSTGSHSSRPNVLRLYDVENVDSESLGALHGQLLAAGYLIADVVGRTDGLSYRITREGLQRLAGVPAADAA